MATSTSNPNLVGIITTQGCKFCRAAKSALAEANIPYQEFELSEDIELLKKVKSTTGRSTVPQIFVNGSLFGGTDDLLTSLKSGEFQSLLKTATQPALPVDVKTILESSSNKRGNTSSVFQAADERQKKQQTLQPLVNALSLQYNKGPFSLKQAVEVVSPLVEDTKNTENTIEKLKSLQLLTTTSKTASSSLMCVQDIAMPIKLSTPLNSHFQWYGPARPASEVAISLRSLILKLYDTHLSPDGKRIAYKALKADPAFRQFVDATAELQNVQLSELLSLSREEKMSFFINVYNALVIHALVAVGPATSTLARLKWFDNISYTIGGVRFTSNDIEHGVLRGNAASPASIFSLLGLGKLGIPVPKTFPSSSSSDPRAGLAIHPLDPRIHFALNCGAVSCPPIRVYSSEKLEFGLAAAASAFCAGEVDVDVEGKKVTLSMILKWYGGDFGGKKELLVFLVKYCSEEQGRRLSELMGRVKDVEKEVKLEFRPYDWSVNSSD
jgi:glutaredoxin